jgi:hypothetical protein
MTQQLSRADFLRRFGGLSAMILFDRSVLLPTTTDPLPHPEPRPGVTSEKVLKVEDLGDKPRKAVREAFEAARQHPLIFDGLACGCGCHGKATYEHRSLLVCYETQQPKGCPACQMEASFVAGMVNDGKSLAEIRAAVDKKFG